MSSFTKYDHSRPENWAEHLERFQFWLDSKGQITDDQKLGLLIEMLDDFTIRDLKDWITPNTLQERTYIELINVLNKNIVPMINPMVWYNKFVNGRQLPGEKAVVYTSELWRLASSCNFEGMTATIVLYQFVCCLCNEDLQAKLFSEKENSLKCQKSGKVGHVTKACKHRDKSALQSAEVDRANFVDNVTVAVAPSEDGAGPNLLGRNWFQDLDISFQDTYFLSLDTSYAGMSNEAFSHTIMNLPAVSGHARSVAFALTTKMEEAIAANMKRGVWIPVNHTDPWTSAIVPVLKRNGTLRLCADYKGTVNHALSSDTYKSPTVDQVLSELAGGCIYGTIDLDKAYTQILVDGDISHMLTVNTVQGLHSVTRLPFGIKIASSAFQRIIDGLLGPVKGVIAYQDNVYVKGTTVAEYQAKLLQVLHILGDDGFKTVKDMLTSHQVLAHYNPDLPLVVTADCSPVGVGAVLAHIVPDAQPERAYSQLDQEELAIIFAVKKLTPYLAFHRFTLITDQKPLLGIFAPNRPTPLHLSSRMLRWTLILSSFDYELCLKPSTAVGHADCLSRLPQPTPGEDVFPEPVGVHLLEARDLCLLSPRDIAKATDRDVVLRQVKIYVHQGWPSTVPTELLPFYSKIAALSLHSECILWHERVVIPSALQETVLDLIHSTHQGKNYSKAMAQSIVWWPNIDSDITNKVKLCQTCQTLANAPPRSIVCPWLWAERAWKRVHLDYAGPFLGHYLPIVIDAYSKWPIVKWCLV
ncbi:hypothetical protein PR048_009434 [Dryococelus australis]|uniref:RNA-directed DNA polymerase n=1 Tax=Dryococelus australis TaxID=614101 RepID=A0ABQ9I0T5_9NEOP|nr:hypothetical protein PR048_009434 [Dryococelus australis]